MRNQGRVIPAVKSFVVGRDYGGDFGWGGVFVIEDLDGYWEYLTHSAHARTDRIGMPLIEKYESYDITDDDDPQMGAKIADLHRRRLRLLRRRRPGRSGRERARDQTI